MALGQEVIIRRWSPGDDSGVWSVLSDGSYSLVNSTFEICLRKRAAQAAIIILLCICFSLRMPVMYVVLICAAVFVVIYMISWLGAVVYLYGSTLRDIIDISKSYFEDLDHHFWVAVCDGEIAGTIAIVKKTSPLTGSPQARERKNSPSVQHHECDTKHSGSKVAWLRRMAVKRKFRGLGIAKKLVLEAVSFSQQAGYEKVFLITTEVHHAARSLYSKLGFQLSAVRPYKYIYGLATVKTFEYEMDL